jgi:hypothetical protein
MDPLYSKLYSATEAGLPVDSDDIADALQSPDQFVRWMGCKAAGRSGDSKWVDRLEELAVSKVPGDNPDVNSIAVWALAKIGGPKVENVWRAASTDALPARRRMAADLIGELRSPVGIDTLARLLVDDELEVLSWAALSAAKLGQPGFDLVCGELAKTRDRRRFLYFADSLMKVNADAARAQIWNALQGWDDSQRAILEQAVLQLTKDRS